GRGSDRGVARLPRGRPATRAAVPRHHYRPQRLVMSPSAEPAPLDRQARRRERTRARLVEAARAVFARQGVDATRINDITAEANDRATLGLDDPAEVVAVAHRSLIQAAIDDPSFGWLLVRLEISHDVV